MLNKNGFHNNILKCESTIFHNMVTLLRLLKTHLKLNVNNRNFMNQLYNDLRFNMLDLQGFHLVELNLPMTDLTESCLAGADLSMAYLFASHLHGANLTSTILVKANLVKTDLTSTDLRKASLTEANLANANLTGANLTEANLIMADLAGADLTGVNLKWTKISVRLFRAVEHFFSSVSNFEKLYIYVEELKKHLTYEEFINSSYYHKILH